MRKKKGTKIQKLLHPETDQPGSAVDTRPPKRGKKEKKKINLIISRKENKKNSPGEQNKGTSRPEQSLNTGPVYRKSNRPNGPYYGQGWYRAHNNHFGPNNYGQCRDGGGPNQHQGWYYDHGPDQQPGWYRDDCGPQNQGQNRYGPGYRPRYFQDPPREGFPNLCRL